MRWDETWHRLSEWTSGQGPSERLAAQLLLEDGFTSLDPSHPLGGRDGKKDAIAWRSNEKWVMAVYFPRGKKSFNDIKEKLLHDFAGVALNNADGLAFVTNQELSLRERSELQESVAGSVEIYHLERITAILDKPAMLSVRAQFLGISGEQDDPASKPVFVRTIPSSLQASTNLIGRTQDLEALSRFLDLRKESISLRSLLSIRAEQNSERTYIVTHGQAKAGIRNADGAYLVAWRTRIRPGLVASSEPDGLVSTCIDT